MSKIDRNPTLTKRQVYLVTRALHLELMRLHSKASKAESKKFRKMLIEQAGEVAAIRNAFFPG